jgi:hypothetical protein
MQIKMTLVAQNESLSDFRCCGGTQFRKQELNLFIACKELIQSATNALKEQEHSNKFIADNIW